MLVGVLVVLWVFALQGLAGEGRAGSSAAEHFAYVQFGLNSDTVYLSSSDQPTRRDEAFRVPHAAGYGIVPSLSPDGRTAAYNVLSPSTRRPSPDSPAELWTASLDGGPRPKMLASGADLLVRPVWSADGDTIAFRRSTPRPDAAGDFQLVAVDVAAGTERLLVESSEHAVFAVGWAGDVFYYVRLRPDGSDLLSLDRSGRQQDVGVLSDYLTRDWSLSPDGRRLAYLALYQVGRQLTSRALVLEIESGRLAPAGNETADEFGPVWSPSGEVAVGRLVAGDAVGGVYVVSPAGAMALASPKRGFDVPLAWSPSGSLLAVRTFSGSSIGDPGAPALALVDPRGHRSNVVSGEVTFLGWIP